MGRDPFEEREARRYENPIASREHILATMEELGVPASFKRLAKMLGIEDAERRDALKNRLGAMVRAGQLVVDRRNVYGIASRMELVSGVVSAHPDGFGFLNTEGDQDDIFLSMRQMKAVFHGDRARVRIRGRDRRGRPEGEIMEVFERSTTQLVGRLYFEDHLAFFEPLNNRINHQIVLEREGTENGHDGQIVVVEIVEQPALHAIPRGRVVSVLGDHLTPDMEVEVALRNNDVPHEFPDEVIEAVDRMPHEVRASDCENRVDLREIPFVTIDGEDARDFDDAVYCEPKDSGGWRLYVAIADVANYVRHGSALDESAFERGTSVYFPQYVVPMLPEKLSNGLCSLNPYVDRLVVCCEMTISEGGRISGYQFYEGVIRSSARLTYTQVAAVIAGESMPDIEHVVPHLRDLHDLYKVLLARRNERGALDFDSTELQFEFDAEGRVASISPRSRNTAHRIIEECMLCANVCAARFVGRHGKPGLYRVHEAPDPEKTTHLIEFLARFGVTVRSLETPADYSFAIDRLRGRKNGHVLQMALLRSLNQAVYQAENRGHFGLNYKEYTHFTSPIRRYPDLLTHRLIKSVIHSKQQSRAVYRVGPPDGESWYPYDMEAAVMMGERCSFTERRADQAVYDVLEWIKCDYISEHVGDTLEGVITGVAKFGFFVELDGVFVEGLVHVSTLAGDYYSYDQASQCLVGERSARVYGLGDSVSVQIARVDVDERKIDFELVTHTPLGGRSNPSKRKSKKDSKGKSKSDRGPSKRERRGKRKGRRR